MLPDNLRYKPLRPDEQLMGMNLARGAVTDQDIMASVDEHHAAGDRCAIIMLLEHDEFVNGWVANEEAMKDLLPFPQVTEAIGSYDCSDSVCFVLVRDALISVGIVGQV